MAIVPTSTVPRFIHNIRRIPNACVIFWRVFKLMRQSKKMKLKHQLGAALQFAKLAFIWPK